MRYRVTAPAKRVNETIAGVQFSNSTAEVDGDKLPSALAYFRRQGYTVTEIQPEPEAEQPPEVIEPPARGATKDAWVTYVTSEAAGDKRLTLDEATALKRDELAEHILGPKED